MNYHIARDGQQIGVFPREDVLARIQQGSIKPTDLVWAEGMPDWKPALDVFPEAFTGLAQPSQPAAHGPQVPPAPPSAPVAPSAGPTTGVGSFGGTASNQPPKPENYLVWAIVVTVLCCLPLGIVSIVFAAQVDSKYQAGDFAGAAEASRKAKLFAWISFGVGLFLILGWLITQGLIFASAAAGNF